jgi:hypothetical protein
LRFIIGAARQRYRVLADCGVGLRWNGSDGGAVDHPLRPGTVVPLGGHGRGSTMATGETI